MVSVLLGWLIQAHFTDDFETKQTTVMIYMYKIVGPKMVLATLTSTYLSCEFAFRAHFQCVVRMYDLECVENANQLVSTQGKIHEYSYALGSVSALTNQNCLFRKNRY